MKLVYPDYYPDFRCIAGDCRHSCCKGWEIDIDADTLVKYRALTGELGDRLNKNIDLSGEGAFFRLTTDEACPFLNSKGLCDIIIEMGDDYLCNICADHPRFRNFISDRLEMGLGLCCEAAAKLALTGEDGVRLVVTDAPGDEMPDAEEEEIIAIRNAALGIANDNSVAIEERIARIEDEFGVRLENMSPQKWAEIFGALEILNADWERYIARLNASDDLKIPDNDTENALGRLMWYFLYRHIPGAAEDGRIEARLLFCILSVRIIAAIAENAEDIIDVARAYSAEIEYSDDNMEALFDILYTEG